MSVPEFMACARGFAAVMAAPGGLLTTELLTDMRAGIYRATQPFARLDFKVVEVLSTLHAAGGAALRFSEKQLASQVRVHPAHLGRMVHKQTGTGILEWRHGLALRMAGRLLVETDCPVKEVAYRSGFAGPEQFTRRFHDAFGMSPTRFKVVARA